MKFAEWITNAENEYAWTYDAARSSSPRPPMLWTSSSPTRREIADDPVSSRLRGSREAAKDAEAYTDVFYATGAVKDALIENVNKAIRGEVDPKTALKTAQDQMNEKLKALDD